MSSSPALASYQAGFYAPGRGGVPLYPEVWRGCVGAWAPCLGPTGLMLRDWSGFGNHSTLTNGPTFAPNHGKYAMSFDGVDDLVDFGSRSVLNCATGLTISLWAKRDGTSGFHYHAWLQRFNAGTVGYQLYLNNSDNKVRLYTNTVAASTYTMSDTNWHHVCTTNNGSTTTFFVDGVEYGSSAQTLSDVPTSTVNNFGSFGGPGGRVNGQMDDMRIYNRALTQQEVRTLASRRGISYELSPIRYAGESLAAYNRRLQHAQLVGGGLIG
jgi:hypothetical protein